MYMSFIGIMSLVLVLIVLILRLSYCFASSPFDAATTLHCVYLWCWKWNIIASLNLSVLTEPPQHHFLLSSNYLSNLLTNATVRSPPWEASQPAGHEITNLLWNPKVHFPISTFLFMTLACLFRCTEKRSYIIYLWCLWIREVWLTHIPIFRPKIWNKKCYVYTCKYRTHVCWNHASSLL